MQININLDETQAQNYANYHGFIEDEGVSLQDFVTNKILERFTNDVTEQNNRKALADVTKVLDVTSDGSQTVLKASISAQREAKIAIEKESVKVIGVK